MLCDEEIKMLRWLGQQARGDVADLGPFLGGSTLPLGLGVKDVGGGSRLHSYDMFVCPNDAYSQGLIGPSKQPGDSVLDLYAANIAPVRDLVAIHAGDICSHGYSGADIGVLFVDVVKGEEINDHVIRTFFWRLTPDAYVVHQDYNHGWLPWVHWTAHLLRPYCDFIADVGGTRLVRMKRAVPDDVLAQCLSESMSLSQKIAALNAERDHNETRYGGAMVQLGIAWLNFLYCGPEAALSALGHPILDEPYVLEQVEQMKASIASMKSREGYSAYKDAFFPQMR